MLFMPVNPLGESHLTHLSTSQQVPLAPSREARFHLWVLDQHLAEEAKFWAWPKPEIFLRLGPYDPYGYLEKHWVPLILGWLSTKDWSKSAVALVWDFGHFWPIPMFEHVLTKPNGTRWYQCTSSYQLPISSNQPVPLKAKVCNPSPSTPSKSKWLKGSSIAEVIAGHSVASLCLAMDINTSKHLKTMEILRKLSEHELSKRVQHSESIRFEVVSQEVDSEKVCWGCWRFWFFQLRPPSSWKPEPWWSKASKNPWVPVRFVFLSPQRSWSLG